MRLGRNALYGLVASLLLFSLSMAVQRTFLGHAPEVSEDPGRSASRATSGLVAGVVASAHTNDDEGIDDAASVLARPATRRPGPELWRDNAPAADPAPSVGSATAQSASDPRGWSNPVSALSSLLPRGVGGTAGAPPAVAPNTAGSSNPSAVREIFFSDSEATACQAGRRDFVLTDLRDLYVCIIWGGLAGSYAAQLTFVSPDGNDYQTITLPFVTPGAAIPEGQNLQQAGWGRNGEAMVVATLPVAGSYIQRHKLAGIWTLKIFLDGHSDDWEQFTLHPRR